MFSPPKQKHKRNLFYDNPVIFNTVILSCASSQQLKHHLGSFLKDYFDPKRHLLKSEMLPTDFYETKPIPFWANLWQTPN